MKNIKTVPQKEELKILKKNNIALAKALTDEKMNVKYQLDDKINLERRYAALRKKNYQLSEVNKKILSLFENTVHLVFDNYEKVKNIIRKSEEENELNETFSNSVKSNFNVSESAKSLKFHNKNSEVASVPSFAVSPMISGCMIQRPTINLQRINITTIGTTGNINSSNNITQANESYMDILNIEDDTNENEESSEILNSPLCSASSPLSSLNEEEGEDETRVLNSTIEVPTQISIKNPTVVLGPLILQNESNLNNTDCSDTIANTLEIPSTSNSSQNSEDFMQISEDETSNVLDKRVQGCMPSSSTCKNISTRKHKPMLELDLNTSTNSNEDKSWNHLKSKVCKRSKPSKKKTSGKDLVINIHKKINSIEETSECHSPNLKKLKEKDKMQIRNSNEAKLLDSTMLDLEDSVIRTRKRKVTVPLRKSDSQDSNVLKDKPILRKKKKSIPIDDVKSSASQEFIVALENYENVLIKNTSVNISELSSTSKEVNSPQLNKSLEITTRQRYDLSNNILELSMKEKETHSPELNKSLKVTTRRSRNISELDVSTKQGMESLGSDPDLCNAINKEETSSQLNKISNVSVKCRVKRIKKLSLPSFVTSRRKSKSKETISKLDQSSNSTDTMNENNGQFSLEDNTHKLRRLRRKDISYKEPSLQRKLRQ